MAVARNKNAAFTLVELLVVIAILGILMGLLLPAVGSVRESMRRTQCKSNLSQIGIAAQQHLAMYGHFPSSGWGYKWVGDPDRGFGARQPGGWIYNLLPFMGLDMIHDIGKGSGTGFAPAEMQTAVIPSLICPTRRRAVTYPATGTSENTIKPQPMKVSKTDYAANGGSFNPLLPSSPPGGLPTGGPPTGGPDFSCRNTYPNCSWATDQRKFDGISGERSEVQMGHVIDGLSNVFLAGEKFLDPSFYYTSSAGTPGAENYCALQGNSYDTNRWVPQPPPIPPPTTPPTQTLAPLRDYSPPAPTTPPDPLSYLGSKCPITNPNTIFGSAHTQGFQMVFCDGSVKLLSFKIELPTYLSLGVRNDGTVSENY